MNPNDSAANPSPANPSSPNVSTANAPAATNASAATDAPVWTPRATVAAVIERDGRFLMVEEDTDDGVRLNQPAGHLEPGESLTAAAIRETLEETAHVLQPVGLLGTYLWCTGGDSARTGTTYLRFAFVGSVDAPIPGRVLDTGIRRAFWITAENLRSRLGEHRSPLVMQCVDDYLAQQASGRDWISLSALHTDVSVSGVGACN